MGVRFRLSNRLTSQEGFQSRDFSNPQSNKSTKMKIIQSMLAMFGVAQAGYNSDATYDCGYHSDINDQIVREIGASYFYTALQYHFSTQELNRPNFVKMLAARAAEERDHAVGLNGFKYENENFGNINSIGDGLDSMIAKEKELTGHLKTLYKKAEDGVPNKTPGLNVNDVLIDSVTCQAPHLSDLMTGTYLPKQLADIHELVVLKNKYTAFVNANHPGHGELLFDKLILD